ncbi:MAG: 50S ribosomal protein L13 [Actinomycetota bacterium]|jgi:large subunit ribosomal protein L13|nr:50S ribosomal protein L13 [Actinomycetota bacterium]MDP9481217.1 50S ribosomal protein L13 [Actinomycetota bacterium]MDP9487460.1 50S ribosomal protein L13 [Actinomycetota bacterium]
MKSYMARPLEVERKWFVVDAEGKHLGRLAAEIAKILRGKNKVQYTPHVDVGDFVVVVNADRVVVTGKKAEQRVYRRHSGYPGGMKETSYEQMLARKPTEILRKAVYGMMPKTRLARQQFKKLKIYAGPEHPHAAQDPQKLEVK